VGHQLANKLFSSNKTLHKALVHCPPQTVPSVTSTCTQRHCWLDLFTL